MEVIASLAPRIFRTPPKPTLTANPFRSYTSLNPRTRALFGLGLIGWASIGLWTSPQVEGVLGMVPSQQEQDELERKMAVRVERVDRE